MMTDAMHSLELATLASSAAILLVLLARKFMRLRFGAHSAYALWALVPLATAAALLPARVIVVVAQAMPAVAQVRDVVASPVLFAIEQHIDWTPWLAAFWLCGAVGALLYFARQQRRFVRGLGRLASVDVDAVRAETSAGCPALLGALRPRIVLPVDFERRYNVRERELILAHERNHRMRGDAQINALAAALRCLFWFNPLVHFAASRLRFDQELACDAAVIARFPDARRPYADAMLKTQLADFGLPVGCHWQSTHPLTERIAMLKQPLPGRARSALGFAVAVTLICGGTYVAWAAQPAQLTQQSATVTPDHAAPVAAANPAPIAVHKPKHDVAQNSASPTDLTSQKLRAPKYPAAAVKAGIQGKVVLKVHIDDRGKPLDAEVANITPETATILGDAAVSAAMQWQFKPEMKDGKAVASYLLVPVDFTLPKDKSGTVVAKAAIEVKNASYRNLRPPVYPDDAIRKKITGTVYLQVKVNADGSVANATVVQASPQAALALTDAAVTAVRSWRFNPQKVNDAAVASEVIVPLQFDLKGHAAAAATQPLPELPNGTRLETIKVQGG